MSYTPFLSVGGDVEGGEPGLAGVLGAGEEPYIHYLKGSFMGSSLIAPFLY